MDFIMLHFIIILCCIYSTVAFTVQDIINKPHARIYFQSEYTSTNDFIDYNYKSTDLCLSVRGSRSFPPNKIKSVETYGTCARIFKFPLCLGESLAIYPGSSGNPQIFSNFGSIGPCLQNEFENAYVDLNGNKTVIFKEAAFGSIPDLIEFGGLKYRKNSTQITCGISAYSQGYNNRLEFFKARINQLGGFLREEVLKFKISEKVQSFYDSLDKLNGDVLGWALPLEFKGSSEATYNVFPQSQKAKEKWGDIIREALKEKDNALLQVNFIYPDQFSTRPLAFVYRFYNKGLFRHGVVTNAPEVTHRPVHDSDTFYFEHSALRVPRAQLTVRSNLTGDSTENYNFSLSKCKNRYVSSDDESITVNTFGTCIRLFEDSHCKGWSLAIYPGSATDGSSNVRFHSIISPEQAEQKLIQSKLNWVFSLGPCFDNEFDYATVVNQPEGKVIVKDQTLTKTFSSISDVLDSMGDEHKETASILVCPIEEVFLGHNSRVEYLRAKLSSDITGSSFVPERIRIFYESLDRKEDDHLSFIIPSDSNDRDETFNVVPLCIEANERWKDVLKRWKDLKDITGNGPVVAVTFSYQDSFSTRPISMVYAIFYHSMNVEYGLIKN